MTEGARRVYIVDDDPGIRESLRFLFEELGDGDYIVEEAEDGTQALDMLRRDPQARVILLDRMMPRMDGVEVLQVIASEPALRQSIAVVFMTARNDPLDRETARLLDEMTVDTLSKPFDLDALLQAVEDAWQRLASGAG